MFINVLQRVELQLCVVITAIEPLSIYMLYGLYICIVRPIYCNLAQLSSLRHPSARFVYSSSETNLLPTRHVLALVSLSGGVAESALGFSPYTQNNRGYCCCRRPSSETQVAHQGTSI